jgi:hypothetical protein
MKTPCEFRAQVKFAALFGTLQGSPESLGKVAPNMAEQSRLGNLVLYRYLSLRALWIKHGKIDLS